MNCGLYFNKNLSYTIGKQVIDAIQYCISFQSILMYPFSHHDVQHEFIMIKYLVLSSSPEPTALSKLIDEHEFYQNKVEFEPYCLHLELFFL